MTRRILALALLIAFAACSSDADPLDEDGDVFSMGSMSARIDGSTWTAGNNVAGNYSGGVIGFAGSDAAGRAIVVVAHASPGAQSIRTSSATDLSLTITDATGQVWIATGTLGTGSLTIDSFSATEASGKFSFTAMNGSGTTAGSRTVTDGVFSVKFVNPTP